MSKTKKNTIRHLLLMILKSLKQSSNKPIYRVVSLNEMPTGEYEATIQVIGKGTIFKVKPEEILADDKMTDRFSPRDIRALTYLGYLGINSPKYRILCQRLVEEERIMFAVHKKGSKKVEMKTAKEISKNSEILQDLDQKDAHLVGYTAATEGMLDEKKLKESLKLEQQEQAKLGKSKNNTN